jgi:hypothetical protein
MDNTSNNNSADNRQYPLSREQRNYYTFWKTTGGRIMMPVLLKFPAGINVQKLAEAVQTTVNAHPFFLANVQEVNGELFWKKSVGSTSAPFIPINRVKKNEFKNLLNHLGERKEFNPDLTKDSLFFAEIYITESSVYLLAAFHHICYDGTTRSIFINDIFSAYSGSFIEPDKELGFDEGNEEMRYRNSNSFVQDEEFYMELFKRYSGQLRLSAPKQTSFFSMLRKLLLPEQLTGEPIAKTVNAFIEGPVLRKFCNENKLTLNLVFLAGVCTAVNKFSEDDYFFFSTETAGRKGRSIDREAGLFVRSFPVGITTDISLPPMDVLLSVKEQYYNILKNHTNYCVVDAIENIGYKNSFNYLYQADTYNLEPVKGIDFDDLTLIVTGKLFNWSKPYFDIDVQIYNFYLPKNTVTDRYMVNIKYDASKYPRSLMKQFANAIREYITQLLTN